ncbi:hypothetical protein [Erythrobacter crassostreae]|uniref:Uncharacterized protein n=1 Tax=Erythrobacter crassostreae TaxID=2828328 RepID=A0A9X1F4I1_9SPHN|nr:hypothetical protein [Erythrobacter crassostrea]MBV7259979.1 hypothetical protein [Erythrobacter crassostrea]
MPDDEGRKYPDPRADDIYAGDRRISRPDVSLPDWEVPDTAYRPIPIVWFTGAFMVQLVSICVFLFALSSQEPWLTIIMSALTTGAIAKWTWDRGMETAGTGWKVATVIMFLFNMLFAVAASNIF